MLDSNKRLQYAELKHQVHVNEVQYYRLIDAKKAATILYGLKLRPEIDKAYDKMQAARDALTKFEKENDTNE